MAMYQTSRHSNTATPPIRRLTGAVVAAFALVLTPWGHAQTLDHFARQWIDQAIGSNLTTGATTPLRPEVQIGTLDPRLQLAPCGRIEPYLPTGTQLWGRTRIGLKCVEGPVAWNVFLPVTVKAWGPAWVMKRTVQANTPLQPGDAELQHEVDWADSRSPIVALPEQWQGMQAAFTLLPGQPIRQHAVKPPQVFSVGNEVKIVTSGTGFEMSASGQAMTAGLVGQTARVKLGNGKIVSGLVQASGSVYISI
jgi:flagella basal body P-ring formation protein FlgA